MKIIDFGKNTYQFEIDFKFDCISPELIREMVKKLLVLNKQFWTVSKDASTSQTTLTRGEGTEKEPLFQLKAGSDKIILWAGWYVSHEKWQQWRTSLLSEIMMYLQTIPIELVGGLNSQYAFTVPIENFSHPDQIPEFQPIWEFYRRFIPEELLKRGSTYLVFGDQEGKEILAWWIGGSTSPSDENITFNFRWNLFDSKTGLEQNIKAHTTRSDSLLERFNSGLLSVLVKS